jgi:phosphoenolpyruvate carboxylase
VSAAAPATSARRTFADDESLLGGVLDEVIRAVEGPRALELHLRAVELGRRSRGGDPDAARQLAELVASLDVVDIVLLVRMLTGWFALMNLAEDNDRVRRIRALDEGPEPRRGSLHAAIAQLAADGTSAAELGETLAGAEVRLVMTAHPTEARRRTTVSKLSRIFGLLRSLDDRRASHAEHEDMRRMIAAAVQEMWVSDELRAVSTTVLDEVRAGLVYFTSTLAGVVPTIYRDLEATIADCYPGEDVEVPPLLTFGSWIGGDRDGNPFVTPARTADTLALMRETCLRHLQDSVWALSGRVTLSARVAGEPPELRALLDALAERFPDVARELEERNPEEPYRRLFRLVATRLRATRKRFPEGYGSPLELLEDLHVAERALRSQGALFVAGDALRDVIRQVEVFGFHFAALDVREHADAHRDAIDEILRELHVEERYAELPESGRVAVLAREIADRRPLIPLDISGFSASTRQVVETFRTMHDLLHGAHPQTIGSYIVSHAEGAADLLEVLLLMKEVGLSRAGGAGAQLRIVPLFESGEALAGAADTIGELLKTPVYRTALDSVGLQEIMVGYSDSNKDVGYVASGWRIYRAQLEMASVLRDHGISWEFFHGRGGAVGRGGGPSYTAVRAQPPGTVAGRLKVTEQGEMLSAKFSVPEIAHRELELITSAALVTSLERLDGDSPDRLARYEAVTAQMAELSMEVYRGLVYGDRDFAAFFHAATPVNEVQRLQLGSRPAKRRASTRIEDFRAIPWVFSWTQARAVLPAWYGLGTALEWAREQHGVELLREMDRDWPFFAALLSNAEMACFKVDLDIARRYAELYEDEAARERIWGHIETEFRRTLAELGRVRDEEHLLDREPILQRALARRKPYVDPLSFVQLELLRRLRAAGDESQLPELVRASLLTINGIAGGMRNTG